MLMRQPILGLWRTEEDAQMADVPNNLERFQNFYLEIEKLISNSGFALAGGRSWPADPTSGKSVNAIVRAARIIGV